MGKVKPIPTAVPQAAPAAPFAFGCDVSVFPAEELAALEQHGARFAALASGTVRPASAEEKHFLRVDREDAEPETLAERAWLRLKARREYEREQRQAPPPAAPQDYGMIEFDADRCWW
jgi:uncharacterized protein YifE (UPF0438 family)